MLEQSLLSLTRFLPHFSFTTRPRSDPYAPAMCHLTFVLESYRLLRHKYSRERTRTSALDGNFFRITIIIYQLLFTLLKIITSAI